MFRRAIIVALCLMFVSTVTASAGLILTFESDGIAAGTTGTVNVWVSSDSTPNPNTLSAFDVMLQIRPPDGAAVVSFFANPQPADYYDDPSYVFANNTELDDEDPHIPAFFVLDPDFPDTVGGGDNADDGQDAKPSGKGLLLAKLSITVPVVAKPGDVYTISMIDGRYTSSSDSYFFSASSGSLEVISAVPEPSSLLLMSGGLAALAFGRRLRHRWTRRA